MPAIARTAGSRTEQTPPPQPFCGTRRPPAGQAASAAVAVVDCQTPPTGDQAGNRPNGGIENGAALAPPAIRRIRPAAGSPGGGRRGSGGAHQLDETPIAPADKHLGQRSFPPEDPM